MKEPTILSENLEFKGSFFDILSYRVKLPNKKTFNWHAIDWTQDSVAIVPIDDKNNVYFSKEWRIAWKRKIVILPAGGVKVNATEEENLNQARNELREEIGFDAKKIDKLVTLLNSARIRNKVHIYLATDLFKSPKKADEDEIVEVVKIPIRKACEMFLNGKEETTGYTLLGIILAMKRLKML